MKALRWVLFPFSLIYGIGVMARNLAFDLGIRDSKEFELPVISVGNLSIGGSGKSPLTEYLIRLLKDSYKVSTLSRGYGRKTKGFLIVEPDSLSVNTGDEPLQFKRKFKDITVAVCESRVEGINKLKVDHDIVILDDAYQHRAVKPGLSILLFDYNRVFKFNHLLPSGDLREPFWEKDRADILMVTKTPSDLNETEKHAISKVLKPHKQQKLFYSYLDYGNLVPLDGDKDELPLLTLKVSTKVILLTGIANPSLLLSEIGGYTQHIVHHNYSDHHNFSIKNITKLVKSFDQVKVDDKLIITTEKDAQRLNSPELKELLKGLPVYYLPIVAEIHEPDRAKFNEIIKAYAAESTVNN